MRISKCPICHNEFKDYSLYKPTTYCSVNCCNYNKQKNALEKSIIVLKPTKEAKKIIKGILPQENQTTISKV